MALITNNLILETLFLCSLPLIVIVIRSLLKYRYWKIKNVAYFRPTFPFGNMASVFLFRETFHGRNSNLYNQIKFQMKLPYAGLYNMSKPVLMVTDPELLKHILIKDFDHFVDRGLSEIDEKSEPLEGHLFNKTGDAWRRLRNKLSPTFTSGKMKIMFPLIEKCSDHLVETINKQFGDASEIDLEVKDYCARYTTDVIGSAAFGVEINSLENPDSEFRKVSQLLLTPSIRNILKMALLQLAPELRTVLNLSPIDSRLSQFFSDLVKNNLAFREKNDVKRDDFLNILMQLKHAQEGKTISPDDVGK